MITLGFAGLPSAGKSTMVNALAGKRVLESGVCRTTTDVCIVGATNTVGAPKWVETKLVSDDGIEFCAVDLPGICDAEDTSGSFDAVTREWAARCDVVVWVTDARTAFLTTHEAREYTALRAALQERADEDGTLYQLVIVLAKYDEPEPLEHEVTTGSRGSLGSLGSRVPIEYLPGEIRTETEHSAIDVKRVERQFPGTRVVKFNAFARILKSGSGALRALVLGARAPSAENNAAFDLKWATENVVEKRFAQMARVLRTTRQRAVAAEAAVAEMRALVSAEAGPVYTTHATLEFARYEGQFSARLIPLPSVQLKIDGSWIEVFENSMNSHARMKNRNSPPWSMSASYSPHYYNGVSIEMHDSFKQIVVPVVKPVYGDVYVNPASACQAGGSYLSYKDGLRGRLCIYTGSRAGSDARERAYVLKVGQVASKMELDALVLALGSLSQFVLVGVRRGP